MDLSRAKTILIVSFLTLNIFLLFSLWQSPSYVSQRGGISSDEAELTRNALLASGYTVSAEIPRLTPQLSLLHVARKRVDGAAWAAKLWGIVPSGSWLAEQGVLRYVMEQETLDITPNGNITLYRSRMGNSTATGQEDRNSVERFLRERGFWYDSLKYDLTIVLGNEKKQYRYLQGYQTFPIFNCYVDIIVTSGQITQVSYYEVEPLSFSGNELQVISAAVAVDTLFRQPGSFTAKHIVEINLGYFSQDYDAERWEIVPVWRFAADDGTVFYVNAFTGEAEAEV
jgi:regulatory protein YycI of two-component signal transduction system YycFG